jgi:hypothetical protein
MPSLEDSLAVSINKIEEFIDLVLCFTPEEKWVFAGQNTRVIENETGVYIAPDLVQKIANERREIHRIWTEIGWKYRKVRTLDDYLESD